MRTLIANSRGISRLGSLIFVLLIASGVFAGSQIFPFYYYYWELQGMMEAQAAKARVFTDDEIRRFLLNEIKRLEIPIEDPEDLKINRVGGTIIIETEYQEVFYLDLGDNRVYDLWVFNFKPRAEKVF